MSRISPQLLAAWRRCREGGARQGDDEAAAELDRLLNLRPWEISPLAADADECPWPPGTAAAASWGPARDLRRELDDALRAAARTAPARAPATPARARPK